MQIFRLAGILAMASIAPLAPASDGWSFNPVPHVSTAGSTTRVTHPALPIPVESDAGFAGIQENQDVGAMVAVEARRGRWGTLPDALYGKVSDDATVRTPQLGDQVSLLAGYRHLSAGIRRGNGLDMDTRMHGPILGLGVRF
jgi:hypothetical protein